MEGRLASVAEALLSLEIFVIGLVLFKEIKHTHTHTHTHPEAREPKHEYLLNLGDDRMTVVFCPCEINNPLAL